MAIRVGTDCSGMEAPVCALRNIGFSFIHAFSCDVDPHVRATIRANYSPRGEIYEDITKRDSCNLSSDIYVAGFPCQPFSVQGMHQGFEDSRGRGRIFSFVRKYIHQNRPRLFLLENVKGLVSVNGGRNFQRIMRSLRLIGVYNLYHRILNTKDHGVPQNRERLYIVGIRIDVDRGTFSFPDPITCPSIECFLDVRVRNLAMTGAPPEKQTTASRNLKHCICELTRRGVHPDKEPWVVDVDSSFDRVVSMKALSPCITARRCDGHWVTNRGRRLLKTEMLRLQGMSPLGFRVAVPERELGKQLGNTMSVNVLERVFARALPAAGFVGRYEVVDRWQNGQALVSLMKTRGYTLEILPVDAPERACNYERKKGGRAEWLA